MAMLSIRNMSFKGKLLVYAASATGPALLLCCAAVMTSEWFDARKDLPLHLAIRADVIGMNSSAALVFDDRAAAEELLGGLKADQNIILACIFSRDGKEFAKYTRAGSEGAKVEPVEARYHRFLGTRLHLRRPIVLDGEVLGSIYFQHDLKEFYGDLKELGAILAATMLVSLGVAFLISSRVLRVLTKPVTELAKTARRVAEDSDYSVRAVKYSEDEFGALTDTFNDMLTQIEERDIALHEHQSTLEESVKARTAELADARHRAETANQAKSEFLANMSHEIRTPMTAILGFAENLLEADQPESERISCVQTIRRNGEYLLRLINDILDLSKIEAGKMTIECRDCQPCRIVAEVASLMRVRADVKGLPFNIEYIGAIPKTIQSDATRLRQILINLVGNAIKFTETGDVRLVTSLVDQDDGPCLQFDIIDTGRGMTQKETSKLFQTFMQGDTSITRKFGGTGLGLTISKRFAELLGGDVSITETAMGVGSTFRVTVAIGSLDGVKMLEDPLSATVVSEDADVVAQASPSDLHGLRILLAEDGPDNQRLISFVLQKAGADVTVKENGKLALEAALAARDHGNPFDVILMDMQMPVMDGYEATKQLREKGYTGPIIALTAHAMDSDRQKCMATGCDTYVTKPFDREKLVRLILEYVQHNPLKPDTDEIPTPERPSLQGCRILLAEDNPTNRILVVGILKKAGAEITAVKDGKLALDAALATRDVGNPFDIILMDVEMPLMGGDEATELLRGKAYTETIIALTANSMEGDREKYLEIGFNEVATKPINRTKLIETIRRHWVGAEAAPTTQHGVAT